MPASLADTRHLATAFSFIVACLMIEKTFGRELRIGATSQRSPSSGPTALPGYDATTMKTAESSTGFRGEKREAEANSVSPGPTPVGRGLFSPEQQ